MRWRIRESLSRDREGCERGNDKQKGGESEKDTER